MGAAPALAGLKKGGKWNLLNEFNESEKRILNQGDGF